MHDTTENATSKLDPSSNRQQVHIFPPFSLFRGKCPFFFFFTFFSPHSLHLSASIIDVIETLPSTEIVCIATCHFWIPLPKDLSLKRWAVCGPHNVISEGNLLKLETWNQHGVDRKHALIWLLNPGRLSASTSSGGHASGKWTLLFAFLPFFPPLFCHLSHGAISHDCYYLVVIIIKMQYCISAASQVRYNQ